jgi:raffinose/stachyose/melibiose transport system permease protein
VGDVAVLGNLPRREGPPGSASADAAAVAPELAKASAAATAGRSGPSYRRVFRHAWALLFLLPALFFLIMIVLLPSVQGSLYAFTNWDGLAQHFNFIGLTNFRELSTDPLGLAALGHTLIITGVVMVGQNVVGMLLALGVTSKIKSKGLLRLVFFIPVIVAPVIVAELWTYVYQPGGPLDDLLRAVGLSGEEKIWLGNENVALWAVIMVILWQYAGFSMIVFMAGLQNVPTEILEAARVDGAGPYRTFFRVTLPQLRPSIVIGVALALLGGLKTFDQVWVMTQGGPGTSTQTLSTAIYQSAFVFGRYGYATALALILTAVAVIFVSAQRFILSRER